LFAIWGGKSGPYEDARNANRLCLRRQPRAGHPGVAGGGAGGGRKGEVVAYEAVKPWATGVGLMSFAAAA
jgi:hypothetical protein